MQHSEALCQIKVTHGWLLNMLFVANYLENMWKRVGKKVFELTRNWFWCHAFSTKSADVSECSAALAAGSDAIVSWMHDLLTTCRYSERVKTECHGWKLPNLDLHDWEVHFLSCYLHVEFEKMVLPLTYNFCRWFNIYKVVLNQRQVIWVGGSTIYS
jgi:hypothetical protein